MKTHLPLLPNKYKTIGWIMCLIFFPLICVWFYDSSILEFSFLTFRTADGNVFNDGNFIFDLKYNNFSDEIIFSGLLLGLFLTSFARRKEEDEWTLHLRLEAILWSVLLNSVFVFITIWFVYSSAFLYALMINLFSLLLIFLFRFEFLIWKDRRELSL
jgi:hypothetical protein